MSSCNKILDLKHLKLASLRVSREYYENKQTNKTQATTKQHSRESSAIDLPESHVHVPGPLTGKAPAVFYTPHLLALRCRRAPQNVYIMMTATIPMNENKSSDLHNTHMLKEMN